MGISGLKGARRLCYSEKCSFSRESNLRNKAHQEPAIFRSVARNAREPLIGRNRHVGFLGTARENTSKPRQQVLRYKERAVWEINIFLPPDPLPDLACPALLRYHV